MPIEYCIDYQRRLVIATGRGTFTRQDVFGYQNEVWSQPEVAGFDELVDMSAVEEIDLPSTNSVWQLASLSASTDPVTGQAKMAIVAPQALAFGLGRMYQAYRELEPRSTKQVRVFHKMEEAEAFLAGTTQ